MDTLTIGELSKVVGLNTTTIRYYEEIKEMVRLAVDRRCDALQDDLVVLLQKKREETRRRIGELQEFEEVLGRFCDDLSPRVSPSEDKAIASAGFCACL